MIFIAIQQVNIRSNMKIKIFKNHLKNFIKKKQI